MECLGCKAFHESKDIKTGEKRKCFICNRDLEKKEDMENMVNKMFGNNGPDIYNQFFGGK